MVETSLKITKYHLTRRSGTINEGNKSLKASLLALSNRITPGLLNTKARSRNSMRSMTLQVLIWLVSLYNDQARKGKFQGAGFTGTTTLGTLP